MNKGAMFGLDCRALKKQFGELFLASRQSEDHQGANGSCGYTKRGAMFGLDARIALAIFGALSVISGAALYSAIQDAEATAVLTELEEIGKAWEQYYLDTGQQLPFASSTPSDFKFNRGKIEDLVLNPGVSGWSGPYLTYNRISDDSLNHGKYDYIYIFAFNDDTDWGESDIYENGYCKSGDDCFIWAYISGMNSVYPNIHNKIDKLVDGGDGSTHGNLKWSNSGGNIFLKIAPIKNRL